MSLDINVRKNILGNKLIIDKKHLEEIQKYIENLEVNNRKLLEENRNLNREVRKLEDETENLFYQSSKLSCENDELKETLSDAIDNVPRFYEYIKLQGFKQSVLERGSYYENYHLDKKEVEAIYKLGSNVVNNFMENDKANIPFKNDISKTATLLFDKQDSSTGSDYLLRVRVTDREDNSIKTYNINDFIKEYEENITLIRAEYSLDSTKLLEEVVNNKHSINSTVEELNNLKNLKDNVLNDIHETYHDDIRGGFIDDEYISSLEEIENAKLDVEIENAEKTLNKYLNKEKELKAYIESNGANYNDYLKNNRVDEITDILDNTHHDFKNAHKLVFEEKTSQSLSL